jgi:hypothetical protein
METTMEPPEPNSKEFETRPAKERQFIYRQNPDGSIDAICLKCIRTAATAKQQWKLEQDEREHICQRTVASRLP